ncbi:helix-turn-helix domain-containing protein [Methanolobus sp. WCC1]|jgi:sugar-specific transcriptional regulator TrmB|uniref:TrmB family transcriptional regulator n=2 Tax=Methanosarcinales TaxID=94695 RepID=UPI000795D507|nr:MAG: transcriptional regulator, TrmB [Methanolobus sp. T82-4]MBP1908533.1 sugar-specific transcriptional regulator TrmB [Methanolobus bombayensis]MDN5310430.1 HTH-type transcriptional regulator, sugar sensing transcriptional regulator [Methanolobus sp.]
MMNSLIDSLQLFGLTSYEAKILVALTQYGSRNAADIHALSGVPRSAVYGVIDRLNDRGIIEVQNTKPMRYRALSPDIVIDRLKANYEDAIKFCREQLENIYSENAEHTEENSAWNINGVKNVNDKILQMMESATEEIIFASFYPSLTRVIEVYPIMDAIKDTIHKKIAMGVKLKLTGREKSHVGDLVKEFPGVQVRTYSNGKRTQPLKGGILVIDNKGILVITINDDVVPISLNATWYNGKEHVQIFKHFVDTEWESSTPFEIG